MNPSLHLLPLAQFTFLLLLALFHPSSPPKLTTLEFKTDDTSYTISFDDSKISESTIRSLIPLSPRVGIYANIPNTQNFQMTYSENASGVIDKTLIALSVELCLEHDPAYIDCANNSVTSPNFSRNAAVNLEKSRKGLEWLRDLPHPKELRPVIDYLVKQLSLSVWMEDAKFRYYSTSDAAVLRQKPAGLYAPPSCPDVFKKLDEAKTKEEKFQVVWHDWHNCVLDATRDKMGTYPLNSWQSFLQDFGIEEKYTEEGPPD